jgi:hypothetical protein
VKVLLQPGKFRRAARRLGWQSFNTAFLAMTPRLLIAAMAIESPDQMVALYAATVDKRLDIPDEEVIAYANLAIAALNPLNNLTQPPANGSRPQFVLLIDKSPKVQAAMLFLIGAANNRSAQLIGASPVSTGRPGDYDYFETPLGVFAHSLANLDFRAEGSKNSYGIRGYGSKGMRVYDFGWQAAKKTWGNFQISTMRLQMHATDPVFLEPRLGSVQSKGCIRIPASLNRLLDRYGVLDADYDIAVAQGRSFWVLDPQRVSTPWSGRYLIVVESSREQRPAWSPAPVSIKSSMAEHMRQTRTMKESP